MTFVPRLPYGNALGIRGRLTLWFVLGALGAVVIGGSVVYIAGIVSIQGTLGQTYCQIASRAVGELENRVGNELRSVAGLATDQLTTEVALETNAVYASRSGPWIKEQIARLSSEWQEIDSAERRLAQLHPELSYRLGVLAGLRSKVVRRFSVYDRSPDASHHPLRVCEIPDCNNRNCRGYVLHDLVANRQRSPLRP